MAGHAGAATSTGEALQALERSGVLDELRIRPPGCVVWDLGASADGLGARLATLVTGLHAVSIGPSPADAVDQHSSPDVLAEAPILMLLGTSGRDAGPGAEPWLERAFELGCPYVYARRAKGRRARAEAVDRWYWRYDVVAVPAGRLALRDVWEQASREDEDRYRHTVGWRRMLPILSPA